MTDPGNAAAEEDRLLTAKEAARYLGYAEGTVRNKASAGELPSVKLRSGALRFRLSALDAWMVERDAVKASSAEHAEALAGGGSEG